MTNDGLIAIDDMSFDSVVRTAGRVLVEVTAAWCPPCQRMKPLVQALARERAGSLRVAILDMDAAPAAAAALGVRGAPTFIVFEDGREIARQLGAMPPTVLRALVDRSG
jgi:thioredoxin 1